MRVYSQSQGKFIEQGANPGVQTQSSTSGTSGNSDALKQAFAGLLFSKKDYKGAYDLLKPEEADEGAAAKKRQVQLKSVAPVLKRIKGYSETAPGGARGAFNSLIGRIPGVEGGDAEYLRRDTEGFARLIASALASEVGVATDKDVDRWKAIMPQPGDTQRERKDRMDSLIKQVETESGNYGIDFNSIFGGMGGEDGFIAD